MALWQSRHLRCGLFDAKIMHVTAAGPFGCRQCFQADAETMARARPELICIAPLVDQSHFDISILVCPACRQRCVNIFTETIDWEGGDDPQLVSILPVTQAESVMLIASGKDLIASIESLGRERQHLQDAYLKGGSRRIRWVVGGLRIGPHD